MAVLTCGHCLMIIRSAVRASAQMIADDDHTRLVFATPHLWLFFSIVFASKTGEAISLDLRLLLGATVFPLCSESASAARAVACDQP